MVKKNKELWWYNLNTIKMTKEDLNYELLRIFNSVRNLYNTKQKKSYIVGKLKDNNKKELAYSIRDYLPESCVNSTLVYLEIMLENEVVFNEFLNEKLKNAWSDIIELTKKYQETGKMCEEFKEKLDKEKEKKEKKLKAKENKEQKTVKKKTAPKKEKEKTTIKKTPTSKKSRSIGWR